MPETKEKIARRAINAELAKKYSQIVLRFLLTPYRILRYVCIVLGAAVLLVSLVIGWMVASFLRSVPDVRGVTFAQAQLIASQKAYARIGDKKKQFRWTPLNEVSREYLYAIVYSEDSTFFEHNGFNFEMMANSLAENIREKRPAFGASTISQQVAKNLFLDNEKTISRKLKEVLVTRDLEKHFGKNQILELYLNVAEFGPELVGVDAAARHFFHKAPAQINAAEGAFIALMLPSPKRNYYSIYRNRNLSRVKKRRIERVLRDLFYEEYVTEKQYREYTHYNFFPDTWRAPAGNR
jgi:monofunctional biosynthetic peptidoglycan transglycosylase